MPVSRKAHYPYHLAKLVAQGLQQRGKDAPNEAILRGLLETMYFASLSTDEGRPCRCTINFVPQNNAAGAAESAAGDSQACPPWEIVPLAQPLKFDVATLTKLAEAADPLVSSLVVGVDGQGELVIWGMVDHEVRYGDFIAQGSALKPQRPGLFQATVAGVGNLSVSKDYELLGSLEQHVLVKEYHDVLWNGPVHKLLRTHLRNTLEGHHAVEGLPFPLACMEDEMLTRWYNAICRTLLHIQQYHHGGGLLIDPRWSSSALHIKYAIRYDRLPRCLLKLVERNLRHAEICDTASHYCRVPESVMPCTLFSNAQENQRAQQESRSEALACARYIAALSKVDGFILLDDSFVVQGFGVEVRPSVELAEIFIAGDPLGTPKLLRPSSLTRFGTRHRAMMRHCNQNPGALGFIVSQDGDIRATMRVGEQLLLWENINLQLAFKAESRAVVAA